MADRILTLQTSQNLKNFKGYLPSPIENRSSSFDLSLDQMPFLSDIINPHGPAGSSD
jgi:hypothetical protein